MVKSRPGFTLLEVLLSISLVAVLTAIGIPVYRSLQQRSDLDVSAATIAQAVRRAQAKAVAMADDSGWGVAVNQNQAVVFGGNDYASRDPIADEIFELSGISQYSGLAEIIFVKAEPAPNTSGDIIISNGNETKTITINNKGMVSY